MPMPIMSAAARGMAAPSGKGWFKRGHVVLFASNYLSISCEQQFFVYCDIVIIYSLNWCLKCAQNDSFCLWYLVY